MSTPSPDRDSARHHGPQLRGWRFDSGRAQRQVPPPDVAAKGFPHVSMAPE